MKRILSFTKNLWSFAFLMLMVSPVFGQVIFTNNINEVTPNPSPNTFNPYTNGQVVDPNLSVSGIGRGAGVVVTTSALTSYRAAGWNSATLADAITAGKYFEWTLTPDAGNVINFQDLIISLTRSNAAFGSNVVLRSSLDGFASDIYTADFDSPTIVNTKSFTIPLSGPTFQNISGPITFRVYAWGADTALRTLAVNAFTFTGSVPGVYYNSITGVSPGLSNPYATGQISNVNIASSGIQRGSGVLGSTGNDSYTVRGWVATDVTGAIAADDYIEWVVAPNAGYQIDFRDLVVSLRVNNIVFGSNVVLRSSVDGFASDIFVFPMTTTTNTVFDVPLTTPEFQDISTPVSFRIYAWGADAASRTLRVNDFNFGGTVEEIPFAPPILNTTAPSPLVFDSLEYDVASASKTVQVYGLNPSGGYPATVNVNAVPNIEVSSDNTTWGVSTSLILNSSAQVPLYIRMVPTYWGSLTFNQGVNLISASFTTEANIPIVGEVAIPAAPEALAATNITANSFDANWNEAPGGKSYNLTVGTWTTAQSLFQDFEVAPPYAGWTQSGITRPTSGSFLINGSGSLRFSSDGSRITSPAIAFPTELKFVLKQVTTGSKQLLVQVSTVSQTTQFTTIQTYTQSSMAALVATELTVDLSAYEFEPVVYIRFEQVDGLAQATDDWSIDDIDVTSRDYQLVEPYDNFDVGDVTTFTVTGLTDFTNYSYFVNAKNNAQTLNSNIIDVTTEKLTVTWDGTAWSNVLGPDETKDAIIDGNYDTSVNGSFIANSLTVNASGILTITAGEEVVLADAFVNNGTASNVIVNSNGNLVQVAVAPVNSGSVTVRRDTQALMRSDYVGWSSPVVGQNLSAFSPLTVNTRFYTYNTTTNLYQAIAPASNTFSGATGYLIRLPNNHPTTPTVWTGEFSGVPNTGTINHTMANIGTGQRFNLIGNPYPSAIELSKFTTENNTTITGTLYFWRKTNGDEGSAYVTYVGGVWSNASSDQNINVGQGFIVEALTGQTNVRFTNAMRSFTNGTSYRSAQEVQTEESNTVWLTLKKDNTAVAYLAVGYSTGATNGIENGKDAVAINDSDISLTSLVDATSLAIQQRAVPFVATDVVALRFKSNVAGTYTISINQLAGLFTGDQNIYLKDVVTNVTHDLKLQDYTFTSEAGVFDARFQLVYENSTLSVNPVLNAADLITYVQDKSLTIETSQQTIQDVTVFDISGRKVLSKTGIAAQSVVFDLSGMSSQVLLVQITTDLGTVTKKVIF